MKLNRLALAINAALFPKEYDRRERERSEAWLRSIRRVGEDDAYTTSIVR